MQLVNQNMSYLSYETLMNHLLRKLKINKQGNARKEKWENDESREGLKMKDEEICILRNHDKKTTGMRLLMPKL